MLELVVELPERRLDAAPNVGPLVLVERTREVVPDVEQPRHEVLRGALFFLFHPLALALLVVLEVRLLARQAGLEVLDLRFVLGDGLPQVLDALAQDDQFRRDDLGVGVGDCLHQFLVGFDRGQVLVALHVASEDLPEGVVRIRGLLGDVVEGGRVRAVRGAVETGIAPLATLGRRLGVDVVRVLLGHTRLSGPRADKSVQMRSRSRPHGPGPRTPTASEIPLAALGHLRLEFAVDVQPDADGFGRAREVVGSDQVAPVAVPR
jgi:hypothetical protein